MKLISSQILKSSKVKNKVITKPKINSVKEIYKFYTSDKIKNNDSFFLKKNVLYFNISKDIERLDKKLESKRKDYIKYRKEYQIRFYDFTLEDNIKILEKEIIEIQKEIISLNEEHRDIIRVIDYISFRDILYIHNKEVCNKVINGKRFNFGNRLGYLEARIVERNHKNKKVDFNKTKLRKAKLLTEGVKEEEFHHSTKNPDGKIKYVVYHTDDDWCRISWLKYPFVKNHNIYEFAPSNSRSTFNGFRNKFATAIKDNPELKTLYPKIKYK